MIKALKGKDIKLEDIKLEGSITKKGSQHSFNFSLVTQPAQQATNPNQA